MRIVLLGGTRFIGRRILEDLVERGDEVLLVHRGEHEPPDLPPCRHLHTDRPGFASVAGEVRAFVPDAVIDCYAMSRSDVDNVLPYLPDTHLILLSSMDVYEAFHLVLRDLTSRGTGGSPGTGTGGEAEPVPLTESARLRVARRIYAEVGNRPDDYEKLEVEPSYLERDGTVLRLAMIYGEHDHQRREEFVLRRVRAGRTRMPVGAGTWLWTRGYVGDVSAAVLACLRSPGARGAVLNIGEPTTRSMRGWVTEILAAAGHEAELVTVPGPLLPEDLWMTGHIDQHMLVDCGAATRLLDWHPDPAAGLRRSVAWHLAHPPADASTDFTADDAALAAALG
jgi:nucleoside-diphosphate-sugar epimerase